MKITFLSLILFLCHIFLNADEANTLYFDDLKKIHSQITINASSKAVVLFSKPIQIRGFLYLQDNQSYLLSSQPNLRSCCMGVSHKMTEQIVIPNLANPPSEIVQYPVLIEGNLVAELTSSEAQEFSYKFILTNAVLKESYHSFSWLTLVISLLLLAITYFGIKMWSKRLNRL